MDSQDTCNGNLSLIHCKWERESASGPAPSVQIQIAQWLPDVLSIAKAFVMRSSVLGLRDGLAHEGKGVAACLNLVSVVGEGMHGELDFLEHAHLDAFDVLGGKRKGNVVAGDSSWLPKSICDSGRQLENEATRKF